MEINIDLTREDYADFNRYYFLKKGLKKRVYIVIFIMFILPLVVNIGDPFHLPAYLGMVLAAGIFFGTFYIGGMFLVMKRTSRLPADKGSILGKKKFIITDEGLLQESESSRSLQKWKSIKTIEFNKNSIFIFVDTIAAYVIPKRFFKDEEEQQLFVKTIEERVKNSQ